MAQVNYRTEDLYQRSALVLTERCGSSERKLLLEALDDMVEDQQFMVTLSKSTTVKWLWLHSATHARLKYQAQRVARKFRATVVILGHNRQELYRTR